MSLNDKTVAGFLLQTVKKYIDKHISVLTTSLNNKNKTKRFKVSKGATSVATGTPFITNESLISFDRIIGNPATSIANIGVDGDYFVESGTIHFKEFNKDIVISCGVNYGVHDISHADVLGQGTTENDISVMKHELDMLSGSGIGHNGIYYIQDVGSKEAGKIYLDKTQEGVWKCLNTTSSINNTSDFERIDNTTLDDKLRNLVSKLHITDSLGIIYRSNVLKIDNSVVGTLHFDSGSISIAPRTVIAKIENVKFDNVHMIVTPIGDGSGINSYPNNTCIINTNGEISIEFEVSKVRRFSVHFILDCNV